MNAQASFILKLVAIAVIACVPLSGESFYIEIVGKVLVPELSGIVVYVVMAVVLLWRPEGILKKG